MGRVRTLVLAVAWAVGCSFSTAVPDTADLGPEHCANGGPACADGLVCSTCTYADNGCVAELPEPGCAHGSTTTGDPTTGQADTSGSEPTGSTLPGTAETTLDPTVTGTTTGSTTTGDTTTSTTVDTDPETSGSTGLPPECVPDEGNADCGGGTPYCLVDQCVSCVEIDCAAMDGEKPACDPDSGLCLECVGNSDCLDDMAPYCDETTATCQPCTKHEHCGSTACNLDDGTCFPPENVLYVDNTPPMCSDGNPGTDPQNPICNLNEALFKGIVVSGEPTTIKVKRGSTAQSETATVPPSAIVAIVRDGNTPPLLIRGDLEPALDVTTGSRVYVHHVIAFNQTLNQTTSMIRCTDAVLWLDEVTVYQAKTGVLATDCQLHVRRSVVFENFNGGIDVTTNLGMSHVWLENSYVVNNGEVFGLRAQKNTFTTILYGTFVGNSSLIAPIVCVSNPPGPRVVVRNSLLADESMKYITGCTFLEPEDGNYKVEAATPMELINMGVAAAYLNGVVKAEPDGPLENVAHWKQGDPIEDYDGEALRPAGDDMMGGDYAGADVPQ